jgi:hypothetical protein
MKFYEAAKYYYYPGMHEPGSQLSMGINKAFWDGLSDGDRQGDHQGSLCRRKRDARWLRPTPTTVSTSTA